MLASRFINKKISPLRADDTITHAIDVMDEHDIGNLPVVNKTTEKLIGQIKRENLEAIEDKSAHISTVDLGEAIKVFERQHVFEAVRLMLKYEIRLLPVVDDDMTYKGVICKKEVLEALTRLLNLSELGSIITIEMERRDYTLSEIVQLIENEGVKILGIAVETPSAQDDRFKVSIKLNRQDIANVSSALRRYGYDIITETHSDVLEIDYEARAGELLRYLDM